MNVRNLVSILSICLAQTVFCEPVSIATPWGTFTALVESQSEAMAPLSIESLQPFKSTNIPKLKNLTLTDIFISNPLLQPQEIVMTATVAPSEIGFTGKAKIIFVRGQGNSFSFTMKITPTHINLGELFPELAALNITIEKTFLILTQQEYTDPDVGYTFPAGLTLYSVIPPTSLGSLMGGLIPKELDKARISSGRCIITNTAFDEKPTVNTRIEGVFSIAPISVAMNLDKLTKGLSGLTIPTTNLSGLLVINPQQNITLDCTWNATVSFDSLFPADFKKLLAKHTINISDLFTGSVSKPRITINVPIKDQEPQKPTVTASLDGSVTLNFLSKLALAAPTFDCVFQATFDAKQKKAVAKIILKRNFDFKTVFSIKKPSIEFSSNSQSTTFFSVKGVTETFGNSSDAFFEIGKKQGNWFFAFSSFPKIPIKPLEIINDLIISKIPSENLGLKKISLPDQIKNLSFENAKLGFNINPVNAQFFGFGQVNVAGYIASVDINAIINTYGQPGLCIVTNLDVNSNNMLTLLNLIKRMQPQLYSMYEQLNAYSIGTYTFKELIDTTLNSLLTERCGFIFSTIPFESFVNNTTGFSTQQQLTTDAKVVLPDGFTYFQKMKLTPEITKPLEPILENIEPAAYGIITLGIDPSMWMAVARGLVKPKKVARDLLENISLRAYLTQAKLRITPINFDIPSSSVVLGVKFRPLSGFVELQTQLLPPDNAEPIYASLKLSGALHYILGGLTALGAWNNPFGIKGTAVRNIAGHIYYDTTAKHAAAVAGETATGGATAGSTGTTAHTATPAIPIGAGFTGIFESDDFTKKVFFAINVAKEVDHMLLWTKLTGKYGKNEILGLLEKCDIFTMFVSQGFGYVRSLVPAQPTTIKIPDITLSEKKQFTLAGDDSEEAALDIALGANLMLTGMPSVTLPFNTLLATLTEFGEKATTPRFKFAEAFNKLPPFSLEDIEVKFALFNAEIGSIPFNRGITGAAKLNIFDTTTTASFSIGDDGIILQAYLPEIDFGALLGRQHANLIKISGFGNNPGPLLRIGLTIGDAVTNETSSISGKIIVSPIGFEGEGEVAFTSNSAHIVATGRIAGSPVTIEIKIKEKEVASVTIILEQKTTEELNNVIRSLFKSDYLKNTAIATTQQKIDTNITTIQKLQQQIEVLWQRIKIN
jgi:hypothetical protein